MYKQVIKYRFHEESSETLDFTFYFFTLGSESCVLFSLFTSRRCQKKKKKKKKNKKHLAGVFTTELTGKLTISFTTVFAGAVAFFTKNLFRNLFD